MCFLTLEFVRSINPQCISIVNYLGVKPKPHPRPKPPGPNQVTYFWEGCYNDRQRRAIRYRLGNFHRAKDPVITCAQAAAKRRFKVFAVENGGECYSGRLAHSTYNRYGPSNRCRRGRGGPWAMDVYKFGRRMFCVHLFMKKRANATI